MTGGGGGGGGGGAPLQIIGSGTQLLGKPLTKVHGPRLRHFTSVQKLKNPAPHLLQSVHIPTLELADEAGGGGGGGTGPIGQNNGSGVQDPPKNDDVNLQGPREMHFASVQKLKIPFPHFAQSTHMPMLELDEDAEDVGGGGGKIGGVTGTPILDDELAVHPPSGQQSHIEPLS